jgi:hypothetical protein
MQSPNPKDKKKRIIEAAEENQKDKSTTRALQSPMKKSNSAIRNSTSEEDAHPSKKLKKQEIDPSFITSSPLRPTYVKTFKSK